MKSKRSTSVVLRSKDKKQVAQWATIAHLGASIMFGDTVIDDAQSQRKKNMSKRKSEPAESNTSEKKKEPRRQSDDDNLVEKDPEEINIRKRHIRLIDILDELENDRGCERIDWRKFEKRISYTKRQDPEGYWYDFKLKYSLPPTDATSSHYDLHSTYEHFDTVCHVTSLKNAMQIITEGHFKLQIVSGDSVVTGKTLPLNGIQCKQPLHPISNVPVIWYGPWKKSKIGSPDITVERYGNVVFSMKSLTGFEGIIRSGLNCYFIEEIQYKKSTASRIFISEKTYSGLRSYDPFVIGGPWYIEKKTGHYFRKDRTLEILREPALGNHYEWWLDNHEVSFSYCSNPRYGVAAVLKPANVSENELQEDYSLQTMRLSFCLKRQQTFRFADNIKQKLYSDLLALHKKALSEKGCKIDLMILERGFTNMFMDPSIKDVVSLYRSYLHYIRLVSDIKDEDQNELFEQILKNLGVSNPKPSSGEEDFSSYSQK